MIDILELIGIVLILSASFWRIFLFDRVKEIAEGERNYDIQERLHHIFLVVSHHLRKDHPSLSKKSEGLNLDGIQNRWELPGKEKPVYKQEIIFNRVAGLLFIIGSLCVVASKFLAYWEKMP